MKAPVADRILARLEGFAEALETNQDIQERYTCRKVVLDLEPLPYDPKTVKQIRGLLHASQALFAQLLGVSVRTVQAWERGQGQPSEMACRWLSEIQRDPEYWLERLRQAAGPKPQKPRTAEGKPRRSRKRNTAEA